MKALLRFLTGCVRWLLLVGVTLYLSAAIYFCSDLSIEWRCVLSGLTLVLVLGIALLTGGWRRKIAFSSPLLILVLSWYLSLKPKMDAPWAPDVAVLPAVEIDGDIVTIKNIRNFNYRSDSDFDIRYYDKVFDLNQIRSVDLFLSYWGTTDIAHTIMSFGFANGEQVAISIETRKEVGEEYSAVQGFFKKFELAYVIADERDFIGVRVLHRNEDVYLYRLKPGPEEARKILLDYLKTVESLEHEPQFYNALTGNCTTSILPHLKSIGKIGFNWALLANGHLDRWRYEEGVWGFDIPFEEFRRRSHINDKVKAAINSHDFSMLIRKGLPSIKSETAG